MFLVSKKSALIFFDLLHPNFCFAVWDFRYEKKIFSVLQKWMLVHPLGNRLDNWISIHFPQEQDWKLLSVMDRETIPYKTFQLPKLTKRNTIHTHTSETNFSKIFQWVSKFLEIPRLANVSKIFQDLPNKNMLLLTFQDFPKSFKYAS